MIVGQQPAILKQGTRAIQYFLSNNSLGTGLMTPLRAHLALLAAILATAGLIPTEAVAQQGDSPAGFRFPAHPASWINSRPFTREQLQNKAAVMVFFEEG
jgi:hypothetical protein